MGGSKKQTIGYHYKWLLHFGWCKGPIDALLELRGGDATFWAGRMTASGQVTINKPDLWGGEKGEGGVTGAWDIMFGEATQAPNDYLTSVLGPQQSGHRGKFTTAARGGRFGAFSPTPKTVSAKIERILQDWQSGTAWYPETAVIPISPEARALNISWQLRGSNPLPVDLSASSPQVTTRTYRSSDGASHSVVVHYSGEVEGRTYPGSTPVPGTSDVVSGGSLPSKTPNIYSLVISSPPQTYYLNAGVAEYTVAAIDGSFEVILDDGATVTLSWSTGSDAYSAPGPDQHLSIAVMEASPCNSMNPAHLLYESITRDDMQGEPLGLINDTSFRAAADRLYSEQFGICTTWDSDSETPEQFQQRICNLIGGSLSQSRSDGLYYLDLIRSIDDPSSLPVITEDDVVSFKQTPWSGSEAVNLIQVEWFDPQTKQTRNTPPVYSAASIQDLGSPNSDTRTYHEVPLESLALRLAARDLAATATPLSKLDLTLLPRWRTLRAGTSVRLQMPSEGIADMVIVVGQVQQGNPKDEKITVSAVQNVYAFPDSVFIQSQPSGWVDPDQPPAAPTAQVAFEAPYIELVTALSSGDLAALSVDTGYLALLGTRPSSGTNYEVDTAAASEDYQAYGIGDWTGSVSINEAAAPLDTAFTYASGKDTTRFAVGGWAVWDSEIVRIDAIDTTAGTISLARGCADTVPVPHLAGSLLLYAGEWVTGDGREYVGGDVVRAKLLTRTASSKLALASATELTVTMNDRQVRPYPPGLLRFDDVSTSGQAYPASMIGAITTHWAHRDRLGQADQLIDESAASLGPETGTTYTVRYYQPPGMLVHTESDLTGTASTAYMLPADGTAQITVEAERDGYASWQAATHTFDYLRFPNNNRIVVGSDRRVTVGGDGRVSRG